MKSKIIKEISEAISNIDEDFADRLIAEIEKSSRIFLWGLGRSGMMARAFAMRLRHLGLESYFIAGLCPPVRKGDLLITISKTGRSKMLLVPVEAAKKSKARTICITATETHLSKICDKSFIFRMPDSVQFGGSLFEQTVLVFLDEVVERYRKQLGISFRMMEKNHANWE